MSGLKSAWELSLEKSDKMVPEKSRQKLSQGQKEKISEIRREYQAKIADKDVTLQDKLKRLQDRARPEDLQAAAEEMKNQFVDDKAALEKAMEEEIEAVRESGK